MFRPSRPLRWQVAVVLVPVILAVAGCGGDDDKNSAPSPGGPTQDTGCGFSSGPFSNAVKVAGDLGAEVTLDFPKPLKPTGLQRTVVTTGKGKQPKDGSSVNATVSVFNGRTGDLVNRQTSTTTIGEPTTAAVFAAGLRCVPIGSRVVATAPASEVFGPEGSPASGLGPADGVIIVTDLAEVVKPPKATGWSQAPDVTFRGRQSPTFAVPTGTPPEEVLVDVIKPGTGAVVRAGDQVTLNYKIVVWGSGKLVQETYGKGKKPLTFGTGDFVPGFTTALLGQRSGARVIAAVPPKFGYGSAGTVGVSGTDTLLVVIEIEATQAQARS